MMFTVVFEKMGEEAFHLELTEVEMCVKRRRVFQRGLIL